MYKNNNMYFLNTLIHQLGSLVLFDEGNTFYLLVYVKVVKRFFKLLYAI